MPTCGTGLLRLWAPGLSFLSTCGQHSTGLAYWVICHKRYPEGRLDISWLTYWLSETLINWMKSKHECQWPSLKLGMNDGFDSAHTIATTPQFQHANFGQQLWDGLTTHIFMAILGGIIAMPSLLGNHIVKIEGMYCQLYAWDDSIWFNQFTQHHQTQNWGKPPCLGRSLETRHAIPSKCAHHTTFHACPSLVRPARLMKIWRYEFIIYEDKTGRTTHPPTIQTRHSVVALVTKMRV